MLELAAILERAGRTVDLEPGHYERLLRRRDRRRRNRRIGSAILAIVVTTATIGYAVTILHGHVERLPTDQITSRTVARIELSWESAVDSQTGGTPELRDGILYANVGSGAQGFRLDCQAIDGSCPSSWSTSLNSAGRLQSSLGAIIVGDRFVYGGENQSHPTVSYQSHRLDAFPRSCGADRCDPAWTSTSGDISMDPVAIAGDKVYAARSDDLLAFALSCRRPVCDPVWTAHGIGAPAFAGGRAFVRSMTGVAAYPSACWRARGPSCIPVWSGRTQGPPAGLGHPTGGPQALSGGPQLPPTPLVIDGHVIVSDGRAIYSFSEDCHQVCDAEWIGRVPGGPAFMPVAAGGRVLAAAQGGSDLFAFPLDCSAEGGACLPSWTGHTDEGIGFQPVVAGNDVLVAGVLGSTLIAFPTTCSGDCSPAWTAPLDDSIAQSPTVSEDVVFVSGLTGVNAFQMGCSAPCAPLFRWVAPGSPQTSPLVEGGALAVVASGTLHVFRLQTGEPMRTSTERTSALPIGLVAMGLVSVIVIVVIRRRRVTFP
jgi:hypothetical protein